MFSEITLVIGFQKFYCYSDVDMKTTEAVAQRCSVKRSSLKFRKIHTKTTVPETLF